MTIILNTDIVQILDNGVEYQVLIRMSKGGVIEHEPFPRTIEGLVSALQISTEVCAGKFFLKQVYEVKDEVKRLRGKI